MRRQIKPNAWSCAITALAMTLDIPVSEVIKEAGHDGSEVIFPLMEEPSCRKGFHSQELIRIAWQKGFAMTPFELSPNLRSPASDKTHSVWDGGIVPRWAEFMSIGRMSIGIVEGWGGYCRHAVHNDHGMLYDPDHNGTIYPLSDLDCEAQNFRPDRMWVFSKRLL